MNGYENYETWLAAIWLDSSEPEYFHLKEVTERILKQNNYDIIESRYELASYIHSMIETDAEQIQEVHKIPTCLLTDLLMHAIDSINYTQIAENYLEK